MVTSMATDRKLPEQQFSKATVLFAAVLIALFSISAALLFIPSGFLASGIILASGAVIVGVMARRVAGATAMWWCIGLGALALIGGALMQLFMSPVT